MCPGSKPGGDSFDMCTYRRKIDHLTKRAKKEGLRSRAYFKLKEINQKYRFIRPLDRVLDLGATPGGWSRYLQDFVRATTAVDLLPMEPLPGVEFILQDIASFTTAKTNSEDRYEVILSDMSPNISGIPPVDQLNSLNLVAQAFRAAETLGSGEYTLLFKVFQSPEVLLIKKVLKQFFVSIKVVKPTSSRPQSSEVYVLAINRKKNPREPSKLIDLIANIQ